MVRFDEVWRLVLYTQCFLGWLSWYIDCISCVTTKPPPGLCHPIRIRWRPVRSVDPWIAVSWPGRAETQWLVLKESSLESSPVTTSYNILNNSKPCETLAQLLIRSNWWYRTLESTCHIIRTQSYSTSTMPPSMHPKQRTIMHYIHIVQDMFELTIGIALNSRRATSSVLRDTRRRRCRPWHLACILNNLKSCKIFI